MYDFDAEGPLRLAVPPKRRMNTLDLLKNRQLGLQRYVGCEDDVIGSLYSNTNSYQSEYKTNPGSERGGIFNLEFSLDGRILVAACEKNCVLIYDAFNQKLRHVIEGAHENCVNCIRFLNERQFATCSDDNTIKLWDTRNLTSGIKTLHGHSNWVKNIEYSERDNIMVTSAFDGSIYGWDLKNPTENSFSCEKLFLMNGLMRTKLSPDGSQMIISTTTGYIMIIHDLDLQTLSTDLATFRPILYRLMQMSGQSFPAGTISNELFSPSRKRNRVEFIEDFSIEVEVISSLQIHPYGWCAVSRSLSEMETHEVTSVHDIQKRDTLQYEMCEENDIESYSDSEDGNAAQRPTDVWMGYISNNQYSRDRQRPTEDFENFNLPTMGIINSGLIGQYNYREHFEQHPEEQHKVVVNSKRLTHYISEQNVGRGFIKELCFSPDGRLICSPFGKGVRLLGFNERYQELTYCVPDEPTELVALVELNDYHSEIVVSCKFNPRDFMLVSGCLNGEIVWYKPVL